jgi:Glyoxalase-like domain
MASIIKNVATVASVDAAWSAIRDIGALHTRLVPGFVTDTIVEDDARIVTFANGMVIREPIISIDDEPTRLVRRRWIDKSLQRRRASDRTARRHDRGRVDCRLQARRGRGVDRRDDGRGCRGHEARARSRRGGVTRFTGTGAPLMAQLVSVTFDCENPRALAAFWSAVLHRDIADGASEFHAMLRAGPTGSCSRCRRETLVK